MYSLRDHQGCSDGKLSGDSSSVPSLSQFSSTPTDITNTSDEEIVDVQDGEREEAQVPDHILMDVLFPPEQVSEEPAQPPPIPLEVQVDQIPFPPTPNLEVPEPGQSIKLHSYRSIQYSTQNISEAVWSRKRLPRSCPRTSQGIQVDCLLESNLELLF